METTKKRFKLSRGTQVLIGLALGTTVGLIFGEQALFLKPIGDVFIKAVRMILAPLILACIVSSLAGMGDLKTVGRLGAKVLFAFFFLTSLSLIIGLTVAGIMKVGVGLNLSSLNAADITVQMSNLSTPGDMLLSLVPNSIFRALADNEALQIVIFCIIFGAAILKTGEKAKPVAVLFESAQEVMFSFINIVVSVTPIGVFCIMAASIGQYGTSVLLPLLQLILCMAIATVALTVIVYIPAIKFAGRYPVGKFFKYLAETIYVAMSTCLSAAALPFELKAMEKIQVHKRIRNFVLVTGVNFNSNGSSLYMSVVVFFVANIYGIDLSLGTMLMVVVSGVLATLGANTVPYSSFMMCTIVLTAVGMPVEGMALVLGIDRILDIFRTYANVVGDSIIALWVARTENAIGPEDDEEIGELVGA